MTSVTGPFPICSSHNVEGFDCGYVQLNHYLQKFALINHNNQSSRTYVVLERNRVIGYFSLSYGSVEHASSPPRVSQGLGRYPIPVLVITRLAVDKSYQKRGVGKSLLKHSLLKAVAASEVAGLRAVVVHAKDDQAKEFYKKYGFEASPFDAMHLFLLMKDLQKCLRS